MNIGLDYDDTYTRDPVAWNEFIKLMQSRGHMVYITTWRTQMEWDVEVENTGPVERLVNDVFCTARIAKEKYMFKQGINIHVWIDDNPWCVVNSMGGYE